MSVSSEFFILSFINFSASFPICAAVSIWLFSTGRIEFLGPVKIPVKTTFIIGAIVGLLHAFVYSLLIFRFTPSSIFANSLLTFAAAAITVFVLLVRFAILYFIKNKITPSFANIIQALHIGIMTFLSALLILLIPSLIVGSITKIASDRLRLCTKTIKAENDRLAILKYKFYILN